MSLHDVGNFGSLDMDKPWLMLGDCLERMREIPDGFVDMVFVDLPYGTTAARWDSIIPFDLLWAHYKRIIRPTGAIVMTASQPFTSVLVMSNLKWFKYEWIWEKGRASGFVHAKNKPMKAHENVLVFSPGTTVHANQSEKRMTYNPQMTVGAPYKRENKSPNKTGRLNHVPSKSNCDYVGAVVVNNGTRFPRSVQFFSHHNVGTLHPTEKPLDLVKYMVKTYTSPKDVVLDNCFGSGTTGVACVSTNRRFIGIEKEESFFDVGRRRISEAIAAAAQPAPLGGLFDDLRPETSKAKA